MELKTNINYTKGPKTKKIEIKRMMARFKKKMRESRFFLSNGKIKKKN
jgi:hypothetical protein